MTTVKLLVQHCMVILAIFLCYIEVEAEGVDCERYPYHQSCRGSMSKRRSMTEEGARRLDCETEDDCLFPRRTVPDRQHPRSRLWYAILGDDAQENAYEGPYYRPRYRLHHEKRLNSPYRRIPLSFYPWLQEDNDY